MAWLKVSELAAEYGVNASTVRAWIKDGMPSARGPGGVTIVDPERAEEWLDAEEADEDAENEPEDEGEDDGLEDDDEDGEDDDDLEGEDE